jgi:3-phosphoshikimate 1-carboxyvinyltransferase
MQAIVLPGSVSGIYTAPASKSAMQRACAAALLRKGITVLKNPGRSEDDRAALELISNLGASVSDNGNELVIESVGYPRCPVEPQVSCGESGLSVRMFTPIIAMLKEQVLIKGSGSLNSRPLHFFEEVLPQLNVSISSNNGQLPLSVQGPFQPVDITIDGSLSSQFLTGLLMAYSAADAVATIHVEGLNSKPYIDLTLAVMRDFGMKLPRNENYEAFVFGEKHKQTLHGPLIYTVEGDWSGAAFALVAGAIAGNLQVKGLDVFSEQADKAILQALMQTGVPLSIQENSIELGTIPLPMGGARGGNLDEQQAARGGNLDEQQAARGGNLEVPQSEARSGAALKPFHFNATHCPDLFPPLVVLAAYCHGTSVIEGVRRLEHKESNRALTLKEEFGKLGLTVELQDDLMIIRGGGSLTGGEVSSRHDHRIAMACAVAALKAEGPIKIHGAEAVNKSYPQFWQHLQLLGASVSLAG